MARLINKRNFPNEADRPRTMVSEYIEDAMNEQGLQIKDIADKLGITYEHARRLVRGEGVPSKFLLKALSDTLGLDAKEVDKIAYADRIRKKFGTIPLEIAGKNPELEPIERAWPKLTPEQKRDATTMITGWARRNRAGGSA